MIGWSATRGVEVMELKWLEDFLSLAATQSFSRSAHERNVTQPAAAATGFPLSVPI